MSVHFAPGAVIAALTLTHYCHAARRYVTRSRDDTSIIGIQRDVIALCSRQSSAASYLHQRERKKKTTCIYSMHSLLTLLGSTAAFAMLERKSWLTRELCEVPLSLDTLELSYSTSETSSFILPFTFANLRQNRESECVACITSRDALTIEMQTVREGKRGRERRGKTDAKIVPDLSGCTRNSKANTHELQVPLLETV